MPTFKAFSQDLYNQFDDPAKKAVAKHLVKKGYLVFPTVEDYGADLIVLALGDIYFCETEIKQGWIGGEWPTHWKTVHLPLRKARLIDKHGRVIFWILNRERSAAILIRSHVLDEKMIKEVPNCKIQSDEYFFDVPIELCPEVELEG